MTIKSSAVLKAQFLQVDPLEHNNDLVDSTASWVAASDAALDAVKFISFAGNNGAGTCTLVGAAIGDVVQTVFGVTGEYGTFSSSFQGTITVVDKIIQSGTADLSSNAYVAVLRPV